MLAGMENNDGLSFGSRLSLAFRLLFDGVLAGRVATFLKAPPAPVKPAEPPKPAVVPPEKLHASGLHLLAALQREGRLIDFLRQDVAGFSDEEVGGAARVIHTGCAKVLNQYLAISPVLTQSEGSTVNVPAGFDAQRIRLTGNITGQPPFNGSLKHHGWEATQVKFPAPSENLDARILAPAEVELS